MTTSRTVNVPVRTTTPANAPTGEERLFVNSGILKMVDASGSVLSIGPGGNFNDAEGDPANVATAAADGTSTYSARRDHVHTLADSLITSRKLNLDTVEAEVSTSQTTGSTSYADLATTGPTVTPNPGIAMDTLSLFGTDNNVNSTTGVCLTALSVGGDTPGDTNTKRQQGTNQVGAVTFRWHAALTTNTALQMKYRVTGGTGTWDGRRLLAVGLS